MECCISGTVPQDPVISRKSGHLFERRLIEQFIESSGKCPITNEPLSKDDLIPVKCNTTVKPRPPSATSIPGMLQLFQNEWDSLMLETFSLKQHLDTVRQELSHSLYQHDAACRVIARLVKERDSARAALTNANVAEPMEVEKPGISKEILAKIQATSDGLSAQRKKRKVPASLSSAEQITKQYSLLDDFYPHKNTTGITCMDLHSAKQNLLSIGDTAGTIVLFDREARQTIATMQGGHMKPITALLMHPTREMILSASEDSTTRIWSPSVPSTDDAKQSELYSVEHIYTHHSAAITGLTLHPTNDYFVSASLDKTWAFNDINTGMCLTQSSTEGIEIGYSCASFHPDGLILGTGTADNVVRIWDINSQENVATFKGHSGRVNSISFSENGYYMASCANDNTVRLWDLRRLSNFHTITLDGEAQPALVRFDFSGVYLAVAVGNDIRIHQIKVWNELARLSSHTAPVTGIAFGTDAKFIVSSSMDRTVKVHGVKN